MKDIDIARAADIKPITDIATQLNIETDDLELYGHHKAKLPLKLIDDKKVKKSKLVLVTAITPTPAGEGKTTMSIALTQGMNKIGKKTVVVLREPSLGPVFGIKGGAAGGGYSQVIPMEDINLHFTGDLSAVEKAHNLLSALIDNNIQDLKRNVGLDPRTIRWKRVMDMNERALRHMVIGLGGKKQGVPRETGFNITAASEVMSTLCLANDLMDLKEKLGNIFIGFTYDDKPIYARDINAHGAMTVLLKDAIKPNLVQTLEGTPAIIHGGPFANIAQGTNTLIATKMGMSLSEYVITEAGFASDLGAEKFFDIKCQYGKLSPCAVVLVATIRAIKYHGGAKLKELNETDIVALVKGLENLDKHVENMQAFGFSPIVAINKFITDADDEVALLKKHCEKLGVRVSIVEGWEKGGEGSTDLAEIIVEATKGNSSSFAPIYKHSMPMEEKIKIVAQKMYGADDVEYSLKARQDLETITKLGLDGLAVCIAKTQKSLSDRPSLRGRPRNFTINIREIEIASGAGFVVPIAGTIMRMPGLPSTPSAEVIDIDAEGNISGLF